MNIEQKRVYNSLKFKPRKSSFISEEALRSGIAQSAQQLSYELDGPGIESRWGARFF